MSNNSKEVMVCFMISKKPYPLNCGYGFLLIQRVLCSSKTEQRMALVIFIIL